MAISQHSQKPHSFSPNNNHLITNYTILPMTDEVKRTNRTTNNHQREEIIRKHRIEGYSVNEAALLTNVPYETARKIISIYNKTQRMSKKKTGVSNNSKVTSQAEVFIKTEK
ncbi:hypothetical protein DMUE_4649 [Dictyocoela muelleri]|nr:hypothetical protein DMUE_4649 [Dictyocoela muelleri]